MKTGKSSESALRNITLHNLSWGTKHHASLAAIQDSWQHLVKMTFPKIDHAICVFTNALNTFWGAAVDW